MIAVAIGDDINYTNLQGMVGEDEKIFYAESYSAAIEDRGTHTGYGIIRRITKYIGECEKCKFLGCTFFNKN